MAFTTSSALLNPPPLRRLQNPPGVSCNARASARPSLSPLSSGRRAWLLALTAATVVTTARELPASAKDIPLFGLRKKLREAEEVTEEILTEGIEKAEKGVEAAEKGIETAEKGIETAEKGIVTAVSFGGLAQAGVVAGAEVVALLVATSVVNGILGAEGQ